MKEEEIISIIYRRLYNDDMWFTTKNDPTFEEAPSYYKLDEYGDLEEKEQAKIIKEVQDYLGDGAIDLNDAVDMWVMDALTSNRIAYSYCLVTKFKNKPVVDGLDAYENTVQLAESKALTESVDSQYYDRLVKMITPKMVETFNLLKDIIDDGYDKEEVNGFYFAKKAIDMVKGATSNQYHLNAYMDLTPSNILNMVDDNDTIEEALQELFEEYNEDSAFSWGDNFLTKLGEMEEPEDDDYEEDLYENKECSKQLTENVKRRLNEENNKSANLISQMFQADDFDSESKQGQIVMRTSNLFNALSDKGYDVQVSFDNGESQSAILLGQQGGKVLITITNADQPLRAFASGNFELTDENNKILSDIQEQITAL